MNHIEGNCRVHGGNSFGGGGRNGIWRHDELQLDDAGQIGAAVGMLVSIEGEAKTSADVLYFPKPRNEDVRHSYRFDKRHFHGCLPTQRGGCSSLSPRSQAVVGKAMYSRAFQQSFTLSSAYPQRIINDCNGDVNSSRPAFISNNSYSQRISFDAHPSTNDSWRGKI